MTTNPRASFRRGVGWHGEQSSGREPGYGGAGDGLRLCGSISSADVGFEGPRDFYVTFARVGFLLGLLDRVIFGLVMRRLVGSEDRTGKTTKLAVLVPLPSNVVIFLSGPSLWTFFALLMLPRS